MVIFYLISCVLWAMYCSSSNQGWTVFIFGLLSLFAIYTTVLQNNTMSFTYREWQMDKNPLPKEISNAVQNYITKMGNPPYILEHSDQLGNVELPEGLQIVVKAERIPKNILLIGVQDEDN